VKIHDGVGWAKPNIAALRSRRIVGLRCAPPDLRGCDFVARYLRHIG
jgi:hypothetical protein